MRGAACALKAAVATPEVSMPKRAMKVLPPNKLLEQENIEIVDATKACTISQKIRLRKVA
jgi:hypothetical protein